MQYRAIKKIKSVEELELGGTYVFENTLYVYAGKTPLMGDAYTFVCELGTYYLNKKGVETIIENGAMRLVVARPEKKSEK